MRMSRFKDKSDTMRYFRYAAAAAAALLCAGCAAKNEPPTTTLEVWDCRGDRPKRLSGNGDPLTPHFTGMELPNNGRYINETAAAKAPAGKDPARK